MSPKRDVKNLAEPEFGRTIKINIWEHGDIFGKCHEIFINPNQLRTWNSILIYLTNIVNPIFGAIRNLVSIKTKQYINCFKDLENQGRYVVLGAVKKTLTENIYKTDSEMEMDLEIKKPVKRFYSGEIGDKEFKFLCTTQKRKLTIIYILVNALTCQTPSKVVLTENDLLVWDTTLKYLSKILDVPGGIQYLCTIYGDIISAANELQHGYIYVALPYKEKFAAMDYLSFFTELEYPHKKGLLLNIRPAQRKYGRKVPTLRTVREKKHSLLEEKISYTVPNAGDGIYGQSEDLVKADILDLGHTRDHKIGQNTTDIDQFKNDINTVETQTLNGIQNNCVETQSQLESRVYTLHNTPQFNNKEKIERRYSDSSKCENIVQTSNTQTIKKCIEIHEKMSQSQSTDEATKSPGEIKHYEPKSEVITQKDLIIEDTQSITKANKTDPLTKDVQYFSISVIISKISKSVSETKTARNISNLNLRKECQAHTYCSNIAVSGTCSDKLETIIKIVNDVVTDAYQRLMKADDFTNPALADTPTKTLIPNCSCSNIPGAKLKQIDNENVSDDSALRGSFKHCLTKENGTVEKDKVSDIDTVKDAKIEAKIDEKLSNLQNVNHDLQFLKINPSKQSECKSYKVNESNYTYSGCGHMPSVHIQNKTYFKFCNLKSCAKDSCNDIKIRYCKKSDSHLNDTCYFCEMSPRIKDYNCRCNNTSLVGGVKTTRNIQSYKTEEQDISKVIENETVYKSVSKKIESSSVTTQTKIVENPVKDVMSLDSISGDVSDSEINESSKKEAANENKQDEPEQNIKDEISITVNISKVSTSSRDQNEISEKNLIEKSVEKNEMSMSQVKANGTVLEKLSYVREIINDILKGTFETPENENLKTEDVESLTEKRENDNIHSSSRNQNAVNETIVPKRNASNTGSKNFFTPLLNKTDENQNKNIEKSKTSKCVPVQICQSVKWGKGKDQEYLCETKNKQVSECCICPKYPPVNDKNRPLAKADRKQIQVIKNNATGAVGTVHETIKNKKTSERKTEVIEGIRRTSLDSNNRSFTSRNSKGENKTDRPVNIERIFDSETRQKEGTAYIESEVFGSDSDISVDSIEESACCICVCPVKYKLNISGVK